MVSTLAVGTKWVLFSAPWVWICSPTLCLGHSCWAPPLPKETSSNSTILWFHSEPILPHQAQRSLTTLVQAPTLENTLFCFILPKDPLVLPLASHFQASFWTTSAPQSPTPQPTPQVVKDLTFIVLQNAILRASEHYVGSIQLSLYPYAYLFYQGSSSVFSSYRNHHLNI